MGVTGEHTPATGEDRTDWDTSLKTISQAGVPDWGARIQRLQQTTKAAAAAFVLVLSKGANPTLALVS